MATPRLTRAQRRELIRQQNKRQLQQVDQVREEAQDLPLSVAELIQREAPNAAIPAALRATLATVPVVSFTTIAKMHSGPLPSTEDIEAYARSIPNGGDRIMAMAEKQQDQRILMERTVVTHQLRESARGQWMGFGIAIFGMATTAFLLYTGHWMTGTAFGGGTFVYLVSLFVLGKHAQSKSLEAKRGDAPLKEATLAKN